MGFILGLAYRDFLSCFFHAYDFFCTMQAVCLLPSPLANL
jgi:hypothetical protein